MRSWCRLGIRLIMRSREDVDVDDSRSRLAECFQESERSPGGSPVVIDFVTSFQVFGVGGLTDVLGGGQPRAVVPRAGTCGRLA